MKRSLRAAAFAAVGVPLATAAGLIGSADAAFKLQVKFATAPAAITNSKDASLRLSRNVHFGIKAQQCKLDSGAWAACGRTFDVQSLAEGVHTARVRLIMKDGRKATASATWRVDSVAPEAPTLVGGSTAWSSAAARTVTRGAATDASPSSGIVGYERRISLDGGESWTASDTAGNIEVSDEGETMVQYRAVDAAGNASPWSQAIVRLDRTAPTAPGVTGGGAEWSNTAVDVQNNADSTDALSQVDPDGYEYQTSTDEGESWSVAANDADHVVSVDNEGLTLVRFRSHDQAGNASAWTSSSLESSGAARVDKTAPAAPAVDGGNGWTNAGSVDLTATSAGDTLGAGASSGIDHYLVKQSTDGETYGAPAAGDGSITVVDEGVTSVIAAACDAAGNCSAYSATGAGAEARIDRTAPVVPTVTGSNGWTNAQSVDLTAGSTGDTLGATASSGFDHYLVKQSTDGGTSYGTPATSTGSVSVTDEGVTDVSAAACDAAGNCSAYSAVSGGAKVQIDRTAPMVPFLHDGRNSIDPCTSYTSSGETQADSTDSGSGLSHFLYSASSDSSSTTLLGAFTPDLGPNTGKWTVDSSQLTGRVTVLIAAVDEAGNESQYTASDDANGVFCIDLPV